MNRINYYYHNPYRILLGMLNRMAFLLSDKLLIKCRFRVIMGKKLNLKHPTTLNEKLQWLKLYDRNPVYTSYVDKYKVKEILINKFGEQYVIPTYGVWDKFDDINFELLPNQFVLKTTNGGGGSYVIICKDKKHLNRIEAKRILEKSLSMNIYKLNREYPYKNIKPQIIAEKLLQNKDGSLPNDYKFNYFNGNLEFIYVSYDRQGINDRIIYDKNWQKLPFMWQHGKEINKEKGKSNVTCPVSFELMKKVGSEIAKNLNKYIRVDLYEVDGHMYFGEITFYHGSGFDTFYPEEYDRILGEKLILPTD